MDLEDDDRHVALLAVWRAAWPTIRGQLSFIDAPRTARRLPERNYDVQLHAGRRPPGEDKGERVLQGIPTVDPPPWAAQLAAEATSPDGFAQFLNDYDEDLGTDRTVLPGLLRIYELAVAWTSREDQIGEVVGRLASTFPDPMQARRLKRDLTGADESVNWLPRMPPSVPLVALLNTSNHEAFDPSDLQIESRAKDLLRPSRRGDLARVLGLIKDARQPLAARFLGVVAKEIDTGAVAALARSAPAAMASLVRNEPALAHDSQLWTVGPADELWKAAAGQRGATQRRDTLAAIIMSGAAVDPTEVAVAWRNTSSLVLTVLAEAHPDRGTASLWLQVVDGQDIVGRLGRSELPSDLLVPAIARLSSHEISKLASSLVTDALAASPPEELVAICLLAAQEALTGPPWGHVAVAAYEQAYSLLGASKRRKGFAAALGAPKGTTNDSLRLELAAQLNKDLSHASWSPDAAFALKGREAFRSLVNADGKGRLAKQLLAAVRSARTDAKKWQLDVVNRAIADHADRDSVFKILQDLSRALRPF